jgi:hypothetical protein
MPTRWIHSVHAENIWRSLKFVGGLLENWAAKLSQCAEAQGEGCGQLCIGWESPVGWND